MNNALLKRVCAGFMLVGFLTLYAGSMSALTGSFNILKSTTSYTEVEFSLNSYEVVTENIDGKEYTRIFHKESGLIMNEGYPELPVFSFSLAVPNRGVISLQGVNILDSDVIKDIDIFPSQGPDLGVSVERGFLKSDSFYQKDVFYPEFVSQVSEPAIMRDFRFVSVTVAPFQYNPARRELEVRRKLTVRVEYDERVTGTNELTSPPRKLSRSFENLYRATFLNYDNFRDSEAEYQARSILVVYHHNSTIRPIVTQFMDWKRQKGFEIAGVSTSSLPTTTMIRSYIQTAYNEWAEPPEYVIIIGSGEGALEVPMFYEIDNRPGDHPYTLLEGSDNISDVFIGRISVNDSQQLATVWNKIRNYERMPYTVNTDWYNHTLLMGSMDGWGISTVYTNKYIKEIMELYDSNNTFTEVYNRPVATPIDTALNQGVKFFHSRGYYNLDGWQPNNDNLSNGFMLPNSFFITCDTLYPLNSNQTERMFRLGTATTSRGGVSVIGMTSNDTKTAFNNALSGAFFYGIFKENMRTMGEVLVKGKVYLHQVYNIVHPSQPPTFSHWANLIGDPSMDIWVAEPKTLLVEYQDEIPMGSNSIVVSVTEEDGSPLKNAWVTARKGDDEIFATAYTDANGFVTLFFDSSNKTGQVNLTVTKPDYRPHLGNFTLSGSPAVVMTEIVWNTEPTAGERASFVMLVKNHRAEQVNGVTGVISVESNYITAADDSAEFGTIPAGGIRESIEAYSIDLSPNTPSGYQGILTLTLTDDNEDQWESRFVVTVQNGSFVSTSLIVDGVENGVINPGDLVSLAVNLRNEGASDVDDLYGVLTGPYGTVIIIDEGYFGSIPANGNGNNSSDNFSVLFSDNLIRGMTLDFELTLFNNAGFHQTRHLPITIGTVTVDDPKGPDAYGYRVYDWQDNDYADVPEYDWIEIIPDLGGHGINLHLNADFNNVQEFTTIDLPFRFTFYGESYDQVSICANGWMSFGPTEQGTSRNWRLPGPLGPNAMIAAFWDNIRVTESNTTGVFYYYDEENHKFIVQWQSTQNLRYNAENTFQVILYDPFHHLTRTGDGPIKIQYKVFNNVNDSTGSLSNHGNWGNFATIGIADHTGVVGLEYSFGNQYLYGARELTDGSAIYFTTSNPYEPFLVYDSFNVVGTEDNLPLFGEISDFTLTLRNDGAAKADNVTVTLTTDSEYVTILTDTAELGSIDVNESVMTEGVFTIELTENIPAHDAVKFTFEAVTEDGTLWKQDFYMPVSAPHLSITTPIVYDPAPDGNNNGVIDPGETVILYLPIHNSGASATEDFTISVTSVTAGVAINSVSQTEFTGLVSGESAYLELEVSVNQGVSSSAPLLFDYIIESGHYRFEDSALIGIGGTAYTQIGTGSTTNSATAPTPINIYHRSLRGQTVYTAAELRNAGYLGGEPIVKLGYYVASAPQYALPNFTIRMRHTRAVDVREHEARPLQTVFYTTSYSPIQGNWDMLTLDTPFVWNGEDNLLVDTSFGIVSLWSSSGRQRVYTQQNGFRYAGSDAQNQINATTTTTTHHKPQIMLGIETSVGNLDKSAPQNLDVAVEGLSHRITWDSPDSEETRQADGSSYISNRVRNNATGNNSRSFLGYNLYRNGLKMIDELIVSNEFVDSDFKDSKEYFYFVTAIYDEGESRPSNIKKLLGSKIVSTPAVDPEPGIYYDSFSVSITSSTPEAEIYYTLDGSDPDETSMLYIEPIQIEYHTLLRARGYHSILDKSPILSAQYYILHPIGNFAAEGGDNLATLSWEAPWSPENRSLVGYNVYRADGEDGFDLINETPVIDDSYLDRDIEPGTYRYYVKALYEQGESQASETIQVTIGGVSVDDEHYAVYVTELLNAYPNPFNPTTTIRFTLQDPAYVSLEVFNIAGKRVKTIVREELTSGRHQFVWNGENDNGRRLSSGIYFYRMQSGSYAEVKKLIMLK